MKLRTLLIVVAALSAGMLLGGILIQVARAQQNDTDTTGWDAAQELTMTNCNAERIDSAVICGGTRGVRVEGYNTLTLELYYTRGAGTGYTFTLEACSEGQTSSDCTDSTDWAIVAGQDFDTTSGVLTLLPATPTRVVSATDRIAWTIGINYKRIRLNNMLASGTPNSSDTMKAVLRVTRTQAF